MKSFYVFTALPPLRNKCSKMLKSVSGTVYAGVPQNSKLIKSLPRCLPAGWFCPPSEWKGGFCLRVMSGGVLLSKQNVRVVDGASVVKRSVNVITTPAVMRSRESVSVCLAGLDPPALKVCLHYQSINSGGCLNTASLVNTFEVWTRKRSVLVPPNLPSGLRPWGEARGGCCCVLYLTWTRLNEAVNCFLVFHTMLHTFLSHFYLQTLNILIIWETDVTTWKEFTTQSPAFYYQTILYQYSWAYWCFFFVKLHSDNFY